MQSGVSISYFSNFFQNTSSIAFAICRVLYTNTVALFLPMSFIFIGSRRDEKIGGFSCGTVSEIEIKNRQLIMNVPLSLLNRYTVPTWLSATWCAWKVRFKLFCILVERF